MERTPVVALITIRAWCEEGSEYPLRAQIRLTPDVSSGFQAGLTVAHTESVVNAVRAFLGEVLCSDGRPDPGHAGVTPRSRPRGQAGATSDIERGR